MKTPSYLEADLRAAHKFEIVVGSVVPVDLVSGFQAEAENSGIEFDSTTRIKDPIGIAISNGAELVGKTTRCCRPTHAKVQDSALQHHKHAHRTFGGLDLWAEEAVKQTEVGTNRISYAPAGNGGRLAAFKVICKLAFEGDRRMNIDSQTRSKSEEVLFGKLEPHVIEIDPKIAVVFVIVVALRRCCRRPYPEAERQSAENR